MVLVLMVGSIVIRVRDLERHKQGPNVSLDTLHPELQVPPRIHLDPYARDQAAEVEQPSPP
jgi:hypothetical protein